ncbi:MAG: ABC transporter ATP-binding protein [Candidatus Muiribacteriota bacterium]|jgi:zinc transport system ATP-binding protein
MDTIIKIENLNFGYNNSLVLENINLILKKNDFLAIIGPNGGGKTTLLKLIMGLLKPVSGKIELLGQEPVITRKKIGYVPQHTTNDEFFPITVEDIVKMGITNSKTLKENSAKILDIMDFLDVLKLKNKKIGELSGGQKQRVLIARALVFEPEILILDEPTASIDNEGQHLIYNYLKKLNKDKTIIIVSHDLNLILSYAKQSACVNKNLCFHNMPEITDEMKDLYIGCQAGLIERRLKHGNI